MTTPQLSQHFEPDQARYAWRLLHEAARLIERIPPEERRAFEDIEMVLDKITGNSRRRRQ